MKCCERQTRVSLVNYINNTLCGLRNLWQAGKGVGGNGVRRKKESRILR